MCRAVQYIRYLPSAQSIRFQKIDVTVEHCETCKASLQVSPSMYVLLTRADPSGQCLFQLHSDVSTEYALPNCQVTIGDFDMHFFRRCSGAVYKTWVKILSNEW